MLQAGAELCQAQLKLSLIGAGLTDPMVPPLIEILKIGKNEKNLALLKIAILKIDLKKHSKLMGP